MAVEVIDTALTQSFYADSGDEIVLTKTGSIITTDFYGLATRSTEDAGIDISVNGVIEAEWYGIALHSSAVLYDGLRSRIDVGAHGQVAANVAISLDYPAPADITVSGSARGTYFGIELSESIDTNTRISGDVYGGFCGVNIIDKHGVADTVNHRVFNSGTITSDTGVGVALQESSAVIRNSGEISGGTAIYAVSFHSLRVVNTGVMNSSRDNGYGLEISWGEAPGILNNSGLVVATNAVANITESNMRVINSGDISGVEGFQLYGGHLFLRNTGHIITEGDALADYSGGGTREIVNRGQITGNIKSKDARYDLTNTGKIDGDIAFGERDDIYLGNYGGEVTGSVNGGSGDDKLVGCRVSDRLDGGADDDRIKGRRGDDELNGGDGNDRVQGGHDADVIDGGEGNDRLRGGEGSDVFVFGERSGTDRVMDFTEGTDILRLVGHTGGFDDLGFADAGSNLRITHDNGVIVLVGQAGLALTAADFDFV